ncbi:MAG: bifunctional diaminohydroxyphosphoribosylaminopyrimidine deaminase/5-amino-6-(5-phosphoribosylamino)uracil reductase RibD [Candidatus Marinimicrobia bacterium]|nr:bifunctional diaminohydroxyphosphoribosylaminopyrimidine deaminase/5-amino-6-(5-phosphoribosylamino)uracil reductase RibD [Candidatus Neomarinimicrobiota bacterium]
MTVAPIEQDRAIGRSAGKPDQREGDSFMSQALDLARRGQGRVSPNPLVGAVLVREGRIVGRGYHERFGGPHAEVTALEEAGEQARGATAYVSLEPCAHTGQTPPCVDAVVRAGIARVVIANRDPNPQVDGRGIARLQAAGIDVTEGVLAREGAELNRGFFHWVTTGRPYVILKAARTQDNFVALTLSGQGWFSSPESRRMVHRIRAEVDGVLVGRRTAERDDPRLTVRDVTGVHPRRIVLDTRRTLPGDLRIFHDGAAETLVFTAVGEDQATPWGEQIRVDRSAGGLDLGQVLDALGDRGFTGIMVEGGPAVHRSFIDASLMDELVLFTYPGQAEPGVRQRRDLVNVLVIPDGWRISLKDELGGDRVVVAQRMSREL